jgi:hypothetical protein
LGIEGIRFRRGPKLKMDGKHRYFAQWFFCMLDRPAEGFKIDQREVAEVKWFAEDELRRQMRERPEEFLTGLGEITEIFDRF